MILALFACYTEDDFDAEYAEAFCAKVFECVPAEEQQYLPYADQAECVTESSGSSDEEEECDFQADVAQTCVEDVKRLTCAQYEDGAFPEGCTLVCTAPE